MAPLPAVLAAATLAHAMVRGAADKCDQSCAVNTDCAPAGSTAPCAYCINKKCASGCQGTCTDSSQCGDPNCYNCLGGQCVGHDNQTCLGPCTTGLDCFGALGPAGSGECTLCIGADPTKTPKKKGVCGAGCPPMPNGGFCTSDAHCLDKRCPHCVITPGTGGKGNCSSHLFGKCQDSCGTDADCGYGADHSCPLCLGGKCGATCYGNCSSDADCRNSTCTHCNSLGVCSRPPAPCGGDCVNGLQCADNQYCSACAAAKGTGRVCAAACGAKCNADSQCEAACPHCRGGLCQAHYNSTCGGPCVSRADCVSQKFGECSDCVEGKCASSCGGACFEDGQCGNSSCARCATPQPGNHSVPGQCAPPSQPCGGVCHGSLDCTGTCAYCYKKDNRSATGVCAAACLSECNSSAECLTGDCPHCVGGKCTAHLNSSCGGECAADADCATGRGGECTLCIEGRCGSTCGGPCFKDDACGNSTCARCWFADPSNTTQPGQCAPPGVPCGATCTGDLYCTEGHCTSCFKADNHSATGLCTAGCGAVCSNSSECLGDCQHCIAGKCAAHLNSTCGQHCVSSADCHGAGGECTQCIASVCTSGCGGPCLDDEACGGNASCTSCYFPVKGKPGQCSPKPIPCGGQCDADSDCTRPGHGNCTKCGTTPGAPVWELHLSDPVLSSPSAAGGVVYVGGNDKNLHAISIAGKLLWSFGTNGAISSKPAVSDGVVYVGSQDGSLYAVAADSGKGLWKYTMANATATNPVYSSPAVSGGVVYVGGTDHRLHAVHAKTGSMLWMYTTGGRVASSPAVSTTSGNDVIFVGSYDGNLYAIDHTGAKFWSYTTLGPVYAGPAVAGGVVYVGSWDHSVYAIDATSAKKLWSYSTGSYVSTRPAVANGTVVVGSQDRSVYALKAATGEKLWSLVTGGQVFSSPAVAYGRAYVGSNDGFMYSLLLENGDKEFSRKFDDTVGASPFVADPLVLAASADGSVAALQTVATPKVCAE